MGSEPIAIIGLSCRFSGDATSPAKLWALLEEGRSTWSEIPLLRFNPKGTYHPNGEKLSTSHIRGGHFLREHLALFDAAFFNFSTETASTLDPQFRLQLESVYEALENAGLPLLQIAGSNTSVFAGTFFHDYRDSLIRDEDNLPRSFITGIGSAMASNRISHFFDLRGASMTIDTGCSTTLVALHQAVENLRSRGSDMSIVSGANVLLNPDNFKSLGSFGFLSPNGKCFAFDERANGYGHGEGVATVIIKRLEDALMANDPIRAIIRESVLNQDGKTETLTSPSQKAQEALMRACYAKAGLEPFHTQYFEAHGTGTATGDPIEVGAIASVFQSHRRNETDALRIGSIKSNIGHTEATSGLASVIKVVLAMENGMLPPSINFEKPNPQLALGDRRLKVVTELEQWPTASSQTMRTSVNNFGYGGSNAHIIMEDANGFTRDGIVNGHANGVNLHTSEPNGNGYQLLVISAKDEHTHEKIITRMIEFLRQRPQCSSKDTESFLRSLIYTLGQRRSMFPWMSAYPIPITENIEGVTGILETARFKPSRVSQCPRIGMVFTGQGAQWFAMGRELIAAYPLFKLSLKEADSYLRELGADWSLMEELGRDTTASRVNQTAFSIPICAAVQISLVRLLESWGVTPAAVTSHSSGEIAAAYAVGAISLRYAMGIAFYRSRLAAEIGLDGDIRGGMLAVGLGHLDVKRQLKQLTCNALAVVACINSPFNTTVAGDIAAIEELELLLKSQDVFARRLRVSTAYHSHHMEPIADKYRQALSNMPKEEPKIKRLGEIAFSSPVTGYRLTNAQTLADPEHWVGSLIQPVQFVDAFIEMVLGDMSDDVHSQSVDIIVEIGPHTALGGPIQEILTMEEFDGIRLPYYGSLVRHTHAVESFQKLAANLLKEGCPLKIDAINFPQGRSKSVRVLTDLPSYPWNHQTRHWLEPRLNLGLRQRDQRPHELLGSLIPGCNPEAPVWRQILRSAEARWVQDHVIQSKMLYPGCGFICLAIEAIKQQMDVTKPQEGSRVSGYHIREMNVQQALVIPESTEGIELQTSLRPVNGNSVGLQDWKEFEIHSITPENRWMLHARGLVMVEFDNIEGTISSFGQEVRYTRPVNAIDMWTTLESLGIKYGPTFRNISNIRQSMADLQATSIITIPDTSVPNDLPPNHIIHPATLDAVAQAAFTALPGAGFHQDSPRVFQSISKLWISSRINHQAGHEFKCHTTLDYADVQGIRATVVLVDQGRRVIEVHGLKLRSLGESGTQPLPGLCTKITWERDSDLNLHSDVVLQMGENEDLKKLSLCFMKGILTEISPSEADGLQGHYGDVYSWIKDKLKLSTPDTIQSDRVRLAERAAKTGMRGQLLCRVGPCLADILRGQTVALDIMNDGNLLEKWSRSSNHNTDNIAYEAALLRQIVHKRPQARVLELGSRVDGLTRIFLEALSPLGSLYHFTNASDKDFKYAERELGPWSHILRLDALDIAQEPSTQGFEPGSYDVVIMSGMAPPSTQALRNIQSLIKPGGKLLVIKAACYELYRELIFSLLPERWDANCRDQNLCLDLVSWDKLLKDAGFSGIDIAVPDFSGVATYQTNTMVSTVPLVDLAQCLPDDIILVTSSKGGIPPPQWLEALQHSISIMYSGKVLTYIPEIFALEATPADLYTGKTCVFVGEMNQPILRDIDATTFEAIKAMTTRCKGLLWVTRGGSVSCENPDSGLAAGFLRTARSEYLGRSYITLDLDPSTYLWSEGNVKAIVQVLKASFDGSSTGEFEYAIRDGVFKIPRLFSDGHRTQLASPVDATASDAIKMAPLSQANKALTMSIAVPKRLDTICFTENASLSASSELSPETVEIEPHAYGINTRDVMIATGQLRDDYMFMGLECAGIITQVGVKASMQGYSIGDKVFGVLPCGGIGSIVRTPWTSIMPMPSSLSFEEAASLPLAFCTAYICLTSLVHLERGQAILVHEAEESVGQAALMMARYIGAEVYATVRAPENSEMINRKFDIPEAHIFSSRNTSFIAGVLGATDSRGVNVVLNSLSGPLILENFNVLAPFGHIIDISQRDSETRSSLEMPPPNRPVSISTFSLLALAQYNPSQLHSAMVEITQLIGKDKISPVHPLTSYSIKDISEAFRRVQEENHVGKVVLSIGPDSMVPVLRQLPTMRFSSDASYLLVGGVGGLGCSIARWMADQGAKSIIILSRSAGKSEQAAALVSELSQVGCQVKALSCDISRKDDLACSLRECQDDGIPPIRGVIQGAMVLKDTLLERMTLADFQTAIYPKVHGTWNLHAQFADPGCLDFFVMLSSAVAVAGNAGQANYAAGGSYQDALARWRVSQGLPGVSINLGAVKDIGVAANTGVLSHLQKVGYFPIHEEQVLSILGTAILYPYEPQVVVGLNTRPGSHWDIGGGSQLGRDMRFTALKPRDPDSADGKNLTGSSNSLTSKLATAKSLEDAAGHIGEAIVEKVSSIFMIPSNDIDLTNKPAQYGIDSLVAVELRNMLVQQAAAEVSIFDILQSVSLAELASAVATKSKCVNV
ncbi:Type I Iterative PKS [Microsporum audouinii]